MCGKQIHLCLAQTILIGIVSDRLVSWHGQFWLTMMCDVDDVDTYDGAPVGIQLLGRRLQEEKMLTIAEYLGQEIAKDAK